MMKKNIILIFLIVFLIIVIAHESYALVIPKTHWSVLFVDSEETVGEDGAAANIFDGDPLTIWHTQWSGSDPLPPHEIQINLGGLFEVDGFRYLPRQDGVVNGTIDQYEFYVSLDGADWGSPVASGTFAADPTEKEVLFPAVMAQFIRLVALTEINGRPYTSAAEITVLGDPTSGNLAPDSVIDLPVDNVTIQVGEMVDFSGHGTDPDGDLPLSYVWHFGDGSGLADSNLQNPGEVQFDIPGVYTVTFTATDLMGLSDPIPATRTLTVMVVIPSGIEIPKTHWSLAYVDSQEISGEDGYGVNAFDGDPLTIWHTQWSGSDPLPPHEIQINLGGLFEVDGFRYLPRQDGGINGMIDQYEFYISLNGADWGSPVASGTFAADPTEKEVLFPAVMAQFIRLVALTEINGRPYTSAAEITVLGNCSVPSLRITQPVELSLLTSTDIHVVANACLDEIVHTGWRVKFLLDGGLVSGGEEYEDLMAPFEATFFNVDKMEHSIKAILLDNNGVEIEGFESQHQVNNVGVGDYFVAFGDSITSGSGDDIDIDNVSSDLRNATRGFMPILNDLLTAYTGFPQTVIREAIGGEESIDGLSRIQRSIDHHPDAIYYLILFGTNDSSGSMPVLSGWVEQEERLLTPGEDGYDGSFLDNMQQIVDAVIGRGKLPYLAKVPIALGPCSTCAPFSDPEAATRNALIREYNIVIDALAEANGLGTAPIEPDFYAFFSANQDEFADNLHPNGSGYQSMAALWFDALTN